MGCDGIFDVFNTSKLNNVLWDNAQNSRLEGEKLV